MAEAPVCNAQCNSCQTCNTGCQGCNTCQYVCNTCQAFCETGGQQCNPFYFQECVSANEHIIKKSTWNDFIDHINFYRSRGRKQNASSWTITDNNDYITAEKFNEVSRGLNHGVLAASGTELRKVSAGDVIYGSYFRELETLSGNLYFNPRQCDNCNISCDEPCDMCDAQCNSCQLCNTGCQGCNAEVPTCTPDPPPAA